MAFSNDNNDNIDNTNNTSILANLFNRLFGYDDKSDDKTVIPRQILCTGKWREFNARRLLLQAVLDHPVTTLTQEQEAILQSECACDIMFNQGYFDEHCNSEGEYTLYIGAGRGSTQMTVRNHKGGFVEAFNVETGYPRNGSPNIELLRATALKVFELYANNIKFITGFDSIYHVLKKNCPVIPDESVLPNEITTTGKDFYMLGYLTDLFDNTPMIVVRNFTTRDSGMRKISFATGHDIMIDLGTGNANLVEPSNGRQLATRELPGDWMTNDESLLLVCKAVSELLDEANEYDSLEEDSCEEDSCEEDSDNE